MHKVKKLFIFIFIFVCGFSSLNFSVKCTNRLKSVDALQKDDYFKRVSLDRIKILESKLRRKKQKIDLAKKGAGVAFVAAVGLAGLKFFANSKKNKSLARQSRASIQTALPQVDYKKTVYNRLCFSDSVVLNYFLFNLLDGLHLGIVSGCFYAGVKLYNRLLDDFKGRLDKVGFYKNEVSGNIKTLSNFFDGLYAFNDNQSYMSFYKEQLVVVHNLFIDAIENLIAIVAASLDKHEFQNKYEWLFNHQNGLYEELNKFSDFLEEQSCLSGDAFGEEFRKLFEKKLDRVSLVLTHLLVDFA